MAITTTYWRSGVSGNWDTASDWSKGVPSPISETTISAAGVYTVSLTGEGSALSLNFDAASATFSESAAGSLSIGTTFSFEAGTVILDGANTITNGFTQSGGNLDIGNANALGSSTYSLSNGEILATSTLSLANTIAMSGSLDIAAASGDVLTLQGSSWSLNATATTTVIFGDAVDAGTVVWDMSSYSSITGAQDYTAFVKYGTLKAGSSELSDFLSNAGATGVNGTLDTAGFNLTVSNLQGQGTVVDSGGAATLDIENGGDFFGAIKNGLSLQLESGTLQLLGTNTYTGTTTVDSGAQLDLEQGSGGTVVGTIVDNGALLYEPFNSFTLTNAISGTGTLEQDGLGTLVIDRNEAFSGGTTIEQGELSINHGAAVGTGALTFNGGELLATATISVSNTMTMDGNITFAAATGDTLTLNKGTHWVVGSNLDSINFGDSSNAGTVVWYTGPSVEYSHTYSVTVSDGTLKAGDTNFGFLTSVDQPTFTVGAAGTFDLAGFSVDLSVLEGSGTITNSGATNSLEIDGGDFTGEIDGALSLFIGGAVTLTGGGSYTGEIELGVGATLDLADTTTRTVDFRGAGTLDITNASGVSETLDLGLASSGDIVMGSAGNEIFDVGATLVAADQISGGGGSDEVVLDGDYTGANALVLNATTITDIGKLYLDAGFSYSLTLNAATVAAGGSLVINGGHLGATDNLTLDASGLSNGTTTIDTGNGTDNLIMGLGKTIVVGGTGEDTVTFGNGFTAADTITGNSGGQTELILDGNYTGSNELKFNAATMTNVQELYLDAGSSYNIMLNPATVVSGATLKVDAHQLGAGDTLTFNGSAVGGSLVVYCGAGTNTVTGSSSGDTFYAESGTDTFDYTSASQSTSTTYDSFIGFNFGVDAFNIPGHAGAITEIDAKLTSGSLSSASFDTDLATALSGHLTAHGAILFTPNAGTLHGQTFLIVDLNGTAGYQAGADLVFHMTGSIGTLATSDFI